MSQRLIGTRFGLIKNGVRLISKCEMYPIEAMNRNWRKVSRVPAVVRDISLGGCA